MVSLNGYFGNNPPLGCTSCGSSIDVVEGQKIYFRLHHKKDAGINIPILSNPKITYLNYLELKDENNLNHLENNYQESFILSERQEMDIPSSGTISVSWNSLDVVNPSDDVTYSIIKEILNTDSNELTREVVYQRNCPKMILSNVNLNYNELTNGPLETFNVNFDNEVV